MNLIINNKNNKYEKDFFNWIIKLIQLKLIFNTNFKKLNYIENYINNNSLYKTIFKNYLSVKDIVMITANNYKYYSYNDDIIICIDSNISIYNTTAKLIDVCKLINYGNLHIKGYPIFSQIIQEIKANLDEYYEQYLNEGIN